MAKAVNKNALVKTEPTEVGPVHDYGQDAGQGFENQTSADIAIPFISILQAMSKPVQNEVEGAKAGKLYNSVTGEIYDEILFVPATTQHTYKEWVPIDDGGGFVGTHQLNSDLVRETLASAETMFQAHKLSNGHELIEAFDMFGVMVTEDGDVLGPAVLGFSSTAIKRYKGINTRLQSFQLKQPDGRKVKPPLYAHLLRVKTFLDQSPQFKWHNWEIEPANRDILNSLMSPEDARYQAGQEMHEMVKSGRAYAANDSTERASAGDDPVAGHF